MKNLPNIAIVAPGNNNFSETFIDAHKRLLSGNIYFYYGNNTYFPLYLEGEGPLELAGIDKLNSRVRKVYRLIRKRSASDYYTKEEEAAFIRSLQRRKIDIVLAEYGQTGALCVPVCKRIGIPLIVHFHGLDASVFSIIEKYYERYQEMFAYASKIIAVSTVMKGKLLELGAPEEKLILNPYGPDKVFFSVEPSRKVNDFLFVGRFVDKKAPYLTLLAFKQVTEVFPEARLKMIGDGPLMNVCVNIVKGLNLQEHVDFLGVCSSEEIRHEMSLSVAYVQHSVTALDGDMEGTPVAIIEASAASLPVISTFHAGIPDVIQDQSTGYLVKEMDVDGMARAMLQILNDPQRGYKMGVAGRERSRAEFSIDKHIGILNQTITEVLNEKWIH